MTSTEFIIKAKGIVAKLRIITCALNEGWSRHSIKEKKDGSRIGIVAGQIRLSVLPHVGTIPQGFRLRQKNLPYMQPPSSRTSTWTSATKEGDFVCSCRPCRLDGITPNPLNSTNYD